MSLCHILFLCATFSISEAFWYWLYFVSFHIWLSHLYSKLPLSQWACRANLRPLLLIFPHLLSADGLEGGVPQNQYNWGASPGLLSPSATALIHSPSIRWHLNHHATFTCFTIHKYTNTQMLCCNVKFYIVFVSLSCISYLYWLYLYFMHIWLTVIWSVWHVRVPWNPSKKATF